MIRPKNLNISEIANKENVFSSVIANLKKKYMGVFLMDSHKRQFLLLLFFIQ